MSHLWKSHKISKDLPLLFSIFGLVPPWQSAYLQVFCLASLFLQSRFCLWGAASLQPQASLWALALGVLEGRCRVLVGPVPASPVKAANKGIHLGSSGCGPGTVLDVHVRPFICPHSNPMKMGAGAPLYRWQTQGLEEETSVKSHTQQVMSEVQRNLCSS